MPNNTTINDPVQIAKEFCNFFTNVGKKNADEIPISKCSFTHFLQRKVQNNMFMAPTDQHEIIKLIYSLKQKNSSGHDNITSSLIKILNMKLPFR